MFARSRPLCVLSVRAYSQANVGGAQSQASGAASGPAGVNANVPGLSSKIVKPPATGKVGPGASATGEYKVPEYYSFNRFSYAEAEVEMAKFRLPQPSALKKE